MATGGTTAAATTSSSTATPPGRGPRRRSTTSPAAHPPNPAMGRPTSSTTVMASTQAGGCEKGERAIGRRLPAISKGRAILAGPTAGGLRPIALCLFALSLCLLCLRLWYSDAAEEWRLRRLPLRALERRAAAGQADFHAALILGERLTDAGRYEEAERTLRKLIGADP